MANHTKIEPDVWESVLSAETILAQDQAYNETSTSERPPKSKFCLVGPDAEWSNEETPDHVVWDIYTWPTLKSIEDNPSLQPRKNNDSGPNFAEIIQMILLNQYCGGSTRFCGTAEHAKSLDTAATFLDVRHDATGQPRHLSIDIVLSRYIWALQYVF